MKTFILILYFAFIIIVPQLWNWGVRKFYNFDRVAIILGGLAGLLLLILIGAFTQVLMEWEIITLNI